MATCTAEQRMALGRKIREGKDKLFPARGGCLKLASELGISPQLLSHWMNGNRVPDPCQLAALAKLFNVSILELCSLPKPRGAARNPSAYDVIADITKVHKEAGVSRKNRKALSDRTATLKTLIAKELGDV